MDWIQPLIIGLMGSFHCMGMCGPLVITLPLPEQSWKSRIAGVLLYNSGRVITYAVLGLAFGFLGLGLYIWGIQQWVSLAMGLIMILSVAFPLLFKKVQLSTNWMNLFPGPLKRVFGRFFQSRSLFSVWMIGMLNGLLPCGLVYIALAGALMTKTPANGALYMILFGIGTIPALSGLAILGNAFGTVVRKRIRGVIPYMVLIIGVLFVLRGMNLGIPYISPKMEPKGHRTEQFRKPDCCKEKE